jgi:soluble lytic murein transglycosylase-like protein
MLSSSGFRFLGGIALFLALAAPAQAQIYTYYDDSGTLVLANKKPLGSLERTYSVPQTQSIRTTRRAGNGVSAQYDDLISEHSRINDVRTDLVRAVVQVESGFNPSARSPKGAMGLMQLMPSTARQFGVRNAFNPVENVRAGVAYLRQLLDRYDNDERLALAAYNAGPGAVDKYGQTVPPYRETKDYVARISQITDAPRPVQMRGSVIYKSTEVVDGREIIRYSDHKPTAGSYQVVGR